MLGIELHILVLAVKCRGDELAAELEKVGSHLTTGEGQRVERVEVDVRSYRGDDPVKKISASTILQSSVKCGHLNTYG